MAFNVRNPANNGWLSIPVTKVARMRNAANSAWITLTGSNFKIRNPQNTAWITGAGAAPSVVTTSGWTPVMDFGANANHQLLSDGKAYGLWADGPLYPYKGSDGVHRWTVPSSENFMFTVPSWTNGAGWGLSFVYDSPRQAPEGSYNNRHWLFGKYALADGTVYSLAHHEWYQTMVTVDGHAGFNGYSVGPTHRWVNGVKWMKSTNNGASWASKGTLSSQDMVLTPEPWSIQSRDTLYGYFHPSNIVEEGGYYYAFVDSRQLRGGSNNLETGFIIIRTANLDEAIGWQFWDGSTWVTINSFSYMGGQGPQQPYVFFKRTNVNPYVADPGGGIAMAQSIRYWVPGARWMLFGNDGQLPNVFCYCHSATLANPLFEANGVSQVSLAGGGAPNDYHTYSAHYVSVFDETSTDRNFTTIMGSTAQVWTTKDYDTYQRQTISIT